jgi:two-component system sensor histidine kinase DesK
VRAWSPEVGSRIVVAVILALAAFSVAEGAVYWLPTAPPVEQVILALFGLLAFGTTFTRSISDALREGVGRNRGLVGLAVCASVSFAMFLTLGFSWAALPPLFAGAAVLTLSPRRAAVVVPLTLGVMVLTGFVVGAGPAAVADLLLRGAVTVVVIGSLGWMASFSQETHRNRAELARLAVIEERLRFSRDLHDVLGHGLSVITLKNEVALLLLHRDPAKAEKELLDALDISKRAVRDLRTLVSGYRPQSLGAEIAAVCAVLEVAGVDCRTDTSPEGLPRPVQDALSWVVREAGTNILRHSSATWCAVKLRLDGGRMLMEIANDKASTEGRSGDGSGLRGLRERLLAVDGDLATSVEKDGVFTLRAWAPITETVAP